MKLSKVWIIQMWWNSSKFSKMRQSTLALAVYQLQICNVLDVGRKIFALSWSYSKAWFIDPGRFSFRHFSTPWFFFAPRNITFGFHRGGSLLERIVPSRSVSVAKMPPPRRTGSDERLLSKRSSSSVSPWGPRGMPWEEKSPRCDKQEQGQSFEHKNLKSLSWCFMPRTVTVEKTLSFARPGRAIPLPEFEAWFKSSLEGFLVSVIVLICLCIVRPCLVPHAIPKFWNFQIWIFDSNFVVQAARLFWQMLSAVIHLHGNRVCLPGFFCSIAPCDPCDPCVHKENVCISTKFCIKSLETHEHRFPSSFPLGRPSWGCSPRHQAGHLATLHLLMQS